MKTLWNIPSRVVARTVGNCKKHYKKFVQNLTICSLWLMEGIDLLCTPQGRVFVHVEQMYAIQIKNLCLKFAKVQFLDHWGKIPGNATFHLRGRFNHIFESLLQLKNVNVIHWSGTELREPLQIVFSRSIIFFSRDTGVAKRATKHFAIEAQSLCPDIDVSYVNPVGYFLSSDVWHLRRSQVFLTIWLSWVTKTEFLLTTSKQNQEDRWWE